MNFFNTIIEDKEKCLSDYNRKIKKKIYFKILDRVCVTLDYRIELFNKALYEFVGKYLFN